MDPVGIFAGGFDAGLAGMRTQSSGKKKLVWIKPKMPVAGNMIDSSAGFLSLVDIGDTGIKPGVS
ncbi:hypothetical protein G9A89_017047 [Geosiphon pyriformis]|nr:hypothetical protein G9A89_017047 [Geosiphon pyriformis]